jgi:hypothetical protein
MPPGILHLDAISFRNTSVAAVRPAAANAIMSSPCTASTSTPTPLRKIPRVTTRK